MLSASKEIVKILSAKCNTYPLVAPEGTKFPFAIYGRTSMTTNYTKFGMSSYSIGFDITICNDTYNKSYELINEIIDDLSKNDEIIIENASEMYSEGAYIQNLSIIINKIK